MAEYPALHWHDCKSGLPGCEDDPCGQLVHSIGPVLFLYVPAAHMEQGVAWPGPVKPGMHSQAPTLVLAAGEVELPGQGSHSALPEAAL